MWYMICVYLIGTYSYRCKSNKYFKILKIIINIFFVELLLLIICNYSKLYYICIYNFSSNYNHNTTYK